MDIKVIGSEADQLIQPEDRRFYVETPDPNFSPERNKAILNRTIEKTNKFFRSTNKRLEEALGGRAEALAYFGDYKFNRGGSKRVDQYLGKRVIAEMVGERILQKVRILEESNRLSGMRSRKIQL